MAEIKRTTLFGKLNSIGYKSIEGATIFCKMRGNPNVETVHWLHQLLQNPDSDLHRIIKHFQLDASRLASDLIVALDRLPRGATAISDFSSDITNVIERGFVYGSLLFGEFQVRTGHVVVGFLNSDLKHKFLAISREFEKIKLEALTDNFAKITAGSPEDGLRASDGSGLSAGAAPGETSGAIAPAAMGKQEALARFSVDLTEKARKGEIDPIVGRDEEIRQVVDILMRRRQNNPILTGEAGVGKTAVVEGFALRIVAGDVPPALKDVSPRIGTLLRRIVIDVIPHHQIQPAIAVVIEERRRHTPLPVGQTRALGDIGKLPAALIQKQADAIILRRKNLRQPVIVDVTHRDAIDVTRRLESRTRAGVRKGSIRLLAEQAVPRAGLRTNIVHEEHIQPPVIIHIDEGCPRADGLQIKMTTAGLHLVNELNPEPVSILEPGRSIPTPASTARSQADAQQDQKRKMQPGLKHARNLNSVSSADTSNSISWQVQ